MAWFWVSAVSVFFGIMAIYAKWNDIQIGRWAIAVNLATAVGCFGMGISTVFER